MGRRRRVHRRRVPRRRARALPQPGVQRQRLNDVRFDLRRGEGGAAFITDSSDQGPNGIIVVDLATGESWRRLHDHPSTKAETAPDLRIVVEGDKGAVGDGLETDADGRLHVTDGEHDAIHRRLPDGTWETVVHDPRPLWPDTLSVAADGHLYVTANQLHRQGKYRGGEDQRREPCALFRTPIGSGPVEPR